MSQLAKENPYQTPAAPSVERTLLRLNEPKTLLRLAGVGTFLSMCPIVITSALGLITTTLGLNHLPEQYHSLLFTFFVVSGTLGISISCFTFLKGLKKRENRAYRAVFVIAPPSILAGAFHVWMGAFVLPFID
jgi:hypothetical protein